MTGNRNRSLGVLERDRLDVELGVDAERRETPVYGNAESGADAHNRVLGRTTVSW